MSVFRLIGKTPKPYRVAPPHSHKVWEVCVYTHGKGAVFQGEQSAPFEPGSIVCFPPGATHREESPGGCMLTYIHAETMPRAVAQRFAHVGEPPAVMSDRRGKLFERVADLLYEEFSFREPGWQTTTQRLWDQLVDYLMHWSRPEGIPLVEQLKFVLLKNVGNPRFRVGEAMDALPISRDHLRVLFASATGKTPVEYLTDLRVNEACALLSMQTLSVKEVAEQVGFDDSHYFSRVFRRSVGVPPGAYVRNRCNPSP